MGGGGTSLKYIYTPEVQERDTLESDGQGPLRSEGHLVEWA